MNDVERHSVKKMSLGFGEYPMRRKRKDSLLLESLWCVKIRMSEEFKTTTSYIHRVHAHDVLMDGGDSMSEIIATLAFWNFAGLVISACISLKGYNDNGLRVLTSMLFYPAGILACIICVAQCVLNR